MTSIAKPDLTHATAPRSILDRSRAARPARLAWRAGAAVALIALVPTLAHAQAGPPPPKLVAQSAELAALRARFEGMTEAAARANGYITDPVCVDAQEAGLPAALGGMGFHATGPAWKAQFDSGKLDPNTPAILLLGPDKRVVGVEWEAAGTITPAPALFGETAPLLPGHPGPPEVNQPHYMLHVYFKPNAQVLISVFDPDLKCPTAATTSAPAAQQPAQLPRTGGPTAGLAGLTGLGLLGAGAALRRLARRVNPGA